MSLPALPSSRDLAPRPSGICPLCGAETAPGQEYCLECGERLTGPTVMTAESVRQMLPFTRPSWFWPAVVGFLVTALSVAGVLFSGVLHKKPNVLNATTPFTIAFSKPPTTTARATTPAGGTTSSATTATPPARRVLSAWPKTRSSAYTLVLASMPASGGSAQPLALARRALAAGLEPVGVLDSKRFASLHPGYFVVFSGIFDSYAAAGGMLTKARASGFNAAYVRQVTR